jgi:molybdenum cofactor synthesis domain-containing protein
MGIVTGGELPVGADAVVPVEDAKRAGGKIYFLKEVRKGEFCFPIGVDVKKGAVVIHAGAAVRAQDIGMLALLGIRQLQVFAKPRVAIIATGNELVDSFDVSDPRKVRESHSPIFENLIRELGGVMTSREIVRDDLDLMSDAVERALGSSDIVLTLGGTSLGEADLVEQTLRRISKKSRIIHGIKMDRGRVAGVAAVRGKPIVMLPGPVQGAMNAFALLALPLILRMTSRSNSSAFVKARLSTGWKARKTFQGFTKVLYVRLERKGEGLLARLIVGDTESISVLTDSNGFVVVPERIRELRQGEEVSVRLLPGFSYVGGQFLAG